MSDRSEAIGLASVSSLFPPPNRSAACFEMNDQLGAAGAELYRRQHRLARVLAALERRHRHLINADNAHDLLHDVGLAMDVGAPRGNGNLHHRAVARHDETEMGQDAPHLGERHLDAREPLDLGQREIDHAVVGERFADHDILRRRAATELHDKLGRKLEARHHEGRIDAALEAIARVRIDAELAPGLRNVDLVP
jgi:hypothetical protein